jgi:hypothetical protein
MDQVAIQRAVDKLAQLTDEERLEVFTAFCTHCGSDDPDCQCWDDE